MTSNPEYTLHYFGVRGKGELIRLCFVAAGENYVDKRYEFDEWPALKSKMPLKQMPVLETSDGKMYCQSLTIARYVAKKFHLLGNTVEEEFFVDMIVETLWAEVGTRIGKESYDYYADVVKHYVLDVLDPLSTHQLTQPP